MKREPVESSTIAAIGYDAETHELHIEFKMPKSLKGAAVWAYHGVAPDEHRELMEAESKGRAFQKIKSSCRQRKIAIVDADGVEHPVEDLDLADVWA